ncbi:GNAT family N-acetyltransferase [Oceanicoccus sp. KOV_DT_Chl]|uniref:GNAT family N-acetyltransferase n=1 Tax=Oceanicoccus sp. KOV_DT_Chl TaxID=1904639 RepID=UPI000C7CFC4A|nr:GNAT family N-acetyltransferase [Oceanicoccus sp. KOV_DT_Chl]
MLIQIKPNVAVQWFATGDSDFNTVHQLCDWIFPASERVSPDPANPQQHYTAAIIQFQKVIACGQLTAITAGSGRRYLQLSKMAVARPFMYCGYRDMLLRAVIARATQLRAEGILLSARLEAIEFYRSHGFVEFAGTYQHAISGVQYQQMILLIA